MPPTSPLRHTQLSSVCIDASVKSIARQCPDSTCAIGVRSFGKGEIVGDYLDANFAQHGFLFDGAHFSPIDDPAAQNGTAAFGINNAGQIVGDYFSGSFGGKHMASCSIRVSSRPSMSRSPAPPERSCVTSMNVAIWSIFTSTARERMASSP